MAAEYVKEPHGPVHVIMPTAGNEFTLCDRDHGQEDVGGFEGTYCNGPATCRECREVYASIREGLKGIRWS